MSSAATNWTAGQQQGLVPANWTVTDGNITGIACNAAAGAVDSFYECRDRLGHDRGMCYGIINGSDVCSCFAFGGWDYTCNEATCTYGTVSGCATRVPTHYYLNAVCLTLSAFIVTSTLVFALSTIWKGRAMCSRNVTSTTLAWITLAALSLWVWYVTMFVSFVVLSSRELAVRTSVPFGRGVQPIMSSRIPSSMCFPFVLWYVRSHPSNPTHVYASTFLIAARTGKSDGEGLPDTHLAHTLVPLLLSYVPNVPPRRYYPTRFASQRLRPSVQWLTYRSL